MHYVSVYKGLIGKYIFAELCTLLSLAFVYMVFS